MPAQQPQVWTGAPAGANGGLLSFSRPVRMTGPRSQTPPAPISPTAAWNEIAPQLLPLARRIPAVRRRATHKFFPPDYYGPAQPAGSNPARLEAAPAAALPRHPAVLGYYLLVV